MPRRGRKHHPANRRNQPSHAHSQQSSVNAAGSGRGGGRGSRGGLTAGSSSSEHPPPPSSVPAAPSITAPVVVRPSVAPPYLAAQLVRPSLATPVVRSVAAPAPNFPSPATVSKETALAYVTPAPSVAAPVVPPSVAAPVVRPSFAALFGPPSLAPVVRPSLAPVVRPPLVAATASSASNFPSPATVSTDTLAAELKQKATIQSAPFSQKATRIPNRPGYGERGSKVKVCVNHFLLELTEKDIHRYNVSIKEKTSSKELCRGLCRVIIKKLVQMYQKSELDNRIPVYDGSSMLFTAGPLPFTSMDFDINLNDENRGSSSYSDRIKHDRKFKVTIEFASKIDLYSLTQSLRQRQQDCTIQALAIALKETSYEKYIVVGESFLSQSLRQPGTLGDGAVYYNGFRQRLRPTQMGLSLNIDLSAAAFYEQIPVTEFVSKHFHLNLLNELSDQDRVKIEKVLQGVKVKLSHYGKIRICKVTSLSKEPLSELKFTRDATGITNKVIDYFFEKYQTVLSYPHLPALQVGGDSRPTYFPMELCQIEAGQRYSQMLNAKQVTSLLRVSCQHPLKRGGEIEHIVKQRHFNTDKLVKEFGIKVRENLALVDARVLAPPTLKYYGSGKESIVSPPMGQWNMIEKKLYDAANVQFWSCISFSKSVEPAQFCTTLLNMCRNKGIIFESVPLVPITQGNPNQIVQELVGLDKKCKATQDERLQLLIIILPDLKGSYDSIKRICETKLGIISQCCQPQKAAKMNEQYLESLALKINVKCGGCNTVLNNALEKRIPFLTDKPTIIFGADITHYHREDPSPSIAAVVASMDWPYVTKYRGIVSAQTARKEIIQDLFTREELPNNGAVFGGIIRESVLAFEKSNQCLPDRIIFYRDGVSESQFSQVLLHEMDAIREACSSIKNGYLPTITFVAVIKRHHTRLFPVSKNEADPSGNVMPGTVVDTSICHPWGFDFYLNSHAGILGTSKPTRYHVLYDENEFTADELQSLTNNLCYTYARCTRSVSIVPPVYYAHLLAFRARSYMSGVGKGLPLPPILDNVKEKMFYC